jgi:hypothetical protein
MKNKIIILVVFAVAVLSSCKKDRSCECTATTFSTGGSRDPFTVKYTYKNITKKQIETRCASYDFSYDSYNSTTTYDCIVK